MTPAKNAWRAVIATLANDEARLAFARLVAEDGAEHPVDVLDGLGSVKGARVRGALLQAGLAVDGDDGLRARPEVFREILSASPRRRPQDSERFLRAGRIDRYPSGMSEREALLRRVADQLDIGGRTLSEPELGDALAALTDDVATLRRYLVDLGILERTRDGRQYRLAAPPAPAAPLSARSKTVRLRR